jgi:hypothetical protein
MPPSGGLPMGLKDRRRMGLPCGRRSSLQGAKKKERVLEDMQLILSRDSRSLIDHSSWRDTR